MARRNGGVLKEENRCQLVYEIASRNILCVLLDLDSFSAGRPGGTGFSLCGFDFLASKKRFPWQLNWTRPLRCETEIQLALAGNAG